MDGKKQGCAWCRGNTGYVVDEDDAGIFVVVSEGALKVYSPQQCTDFQFEMPIKYCPMCGAKF